MIVKTESPETTQKRMAALDQYRILNSPKEEAFDDVVGLASYICDTPIALISFVDEHQQWFKSKVGIVASGSPIQESICAHAIQQKDIFTVADTLEDPRFAGYECVTGTPHIRFYAGAPLVTPDGVALGTLCAIDRVPRVLTKSQQAALKTLARQTMNLMELRIRNQQLARTLAEKEAALERFK